jgi:hypothetical protein
VTRLLPCWYLELFYLQQYFVFNLSMLVLILEIPIKLHFKRGLHFTTINEYHASDLMEELKNIRLTWANLNAFRFPKAILLIRSRE